MTTAPSRALSRADGNKELLLTISSVSHQQSCLPQPSRCCPTASPVRCAVGGAAGASQMPELAVIA